MAARAAARRRRSPGQVEVWPRVKPLPPYCYDCRSVMRNPTTHGFTRQHRDATRSREYREGGGRWLRPRYFDYSRRPAEEGTPAQNRSATRRLAEMA